MASYITRRLIFILPVALLVSFFVFFLIHLVPGDPAAVLLGEDATPQNLAALRKELGLDQPLLTQYVLWLGQSLHGNFGRSIQLQQPVLEAILQRAPVTLELGIAALLFSIVIAVPLGVVSATRANGRLDTTVNVTSLLGTAIPGFVLGLGLIVVFAVFIRLFPPGGYVPFSEDPAANLGGAVIVETIFQWPGLGALAVSSLLSKDYPVIQATVLLSALSYMLVNLLVDVGYGLLDPRISYGKGR